MWHRVWEAINPFYKSVMKRKRDEDRTSYHHRLVMQRTEVLTAGKSAFGAVQALKFVNHGKCVCGHPFNEASTGSYHVFNHITAKG